MDIHLHSCAVFHPLLALLFAGLVGCGHEVSSPIHEEIDFSESKAIFSPQAINVSRTEVDPEGIVATVNGTTINNAQLQRALNERVAQVKSRYSPEQIQEMAQGLARDSLNDMVTRILLLGEIESENVTISDERIDETLSEAKRALENRGGNWNDFLIQTGASEEDVRNQTKQQLQIKQLLQSHVPKPPEPTEEQITEFFEKSRDDFRTPESVEYRHIFVKVEGDADERAWDVAEERVEELRSLAEEAISFEELAQKFSDDETTRENGGLAAPVFKGRMNPALDTALFGAEESDILKPIRTPDGFHLIRVEKKLPPRNLELDEVRMEITKYIRGQAEQAGYSAYIKELTDKAEIVFEGSKVGEPAPESEAAAGNPAGG